MIEQNMTMEQLCDHLKTSVETGLCQNEAEERLKRNGPNKSPLLQYSKDCKYFVKLLFGGYKFFLWNNLLFCCILYIIDTFSNSVSKDHLFYMSSILSFLIFLSTIKSLLKKDEREEMLHEVSSRLEKKVNVFRDGKTIRMNSEELVKGDVVDIFKGDVIPADLRLITCDNLVVSNVFLTGDFQKAKKDSEIINENKNDVTSILDASNLALLGSYVNNGTAKGVVISTGKDTAMHRITEYVKYGNDNSRMIRKEINRFKYMIKVIGSFAGIISYIFFLLVGKTGNDAALFFTGFNIASICLYVQIDEYKEKMCKM